MIQSRATDELGEVQPTRTELYKDWGFTEAASKNTLFQAKKNLREMLEPPRSSDATSAG